MQNIRAQWRWAKTTLNTGLQQFLIRTRATLNFQDWA